MNTLFSFYAALDGQADELYPSSITQMTTAAAESFGWASAVYDNIKRTEKFLEDYEMETPYVFRLHCTQPDYDQILERYLGRYYKSRLKFYQAFDNWEWLWAVLSFIKEYRTNY